jgi:hypothetical protein
MVNSEWSIWTLIIFLLMYDGREQGMRQHKEQFPNRVGDHWRYKRMEQGNKASYLDVDVIDSMELPNGEIAHIWVYHYPDGIDTNYVSSQKGEVKIYSSYFNYCNPCTGIMPLEKMKYVFPLSVGKTWTVDREYGDTIKVINQTELNINNISYPDTYILINNRNESVRIGNFLNRDTIFFTPYIGVVKFIKRDNYSGSLYQNGTWALEESGKNIER